MEILFNAIAPIFLLVVAGSGLGRAKLVPTSVAGSLMQYVFYGAAPAVVFYAVVSNPLSKLLYWQFWVAYPLSLLIVLIITALFFKLFLRRGLFVSIILGFAAVVSNTVIIGYPVLSGFVGHFAAIPMAITVVVFALIFIPALIFIYEMHVQAEKNESPNLMHTIKSAVIGTIKNPLVIGVLLGVVFSVGHIPVPKFFNTFVMYLAESIVPCALFAVGLDMVEFSFKSNKLFDVILVSFINLIITPVITIFIAKALDLSPLFAFSLVVFSTVPTAKTLYIIAGKYQIFNKEMAAIISMTTIGSVVTIPLFIYIAKLIWPTAIPGLM